MYLSRMKAVFVLSVMLMLTGCPERTSKQSKKSPTEDVSSPSQSEQNTDASSPDNTETPSPSPSTPPVPTELPGTPVVDNTVLIVNPVEDARCDNGGIEIHQGEDDNNNELLDLDEVDNAKTQIVCHGSFGLNDVNIPNLYSSSTFEEYGENCFHGGYKNTIGLASSELRSSVYVCNVNNPPTIDDIENNVPITGTKYSVAIKGSDPDFYDDVTVTIVDKPEWLIVTNTYSSRAVLTGLVPDEINKEYTIVAEVTDTQLTYRKSIKIIAEEGIIVSVIKPDVIEGDDGITQGTFTFTLSKSSSNNIVLMYSSRENIENWNFVESDRELLFLPEEIEKTVVVNIVGDAIPELNENILLDLEIKTASENIYVQQYTQLKIINDDKIFFYTEEENLYELNSLISLSLNSSEEITDENKMLYNNPEWMQVSSIDENGKKALIGNPSVSLINETGSIELHTSIVDFEELSMIDGVFSIEYEVIERPDLPAEVIEP